VTLSVDVLIGSKYKRGFLDRVKTLECLRYLDLANGADVADGWLEWVDIHEVLLALPELSSIGLGFIQGAFLDFPEHSLVSVQELELKDLELAPGQLSNILAACARPLTHLVMQYTSWPEDARAVLRPYSNTLQVLAFQLRSRARVPPAQLDCYLQDCTQIRDLTLCENTYSDQTIWRLPASLETLRVYADHLDSPDSASSFVVSLISLMGKHRAMQDVTLVANQKMPRMRVEAPAAQLSLQRTQQLEVRPRCLLAFNKVDGRTGSCQATSLDNGSVQD
jgi:hypothetical protein